MSSTKLVDSGAGTMSDLSKQMRQQRKQFEASMENDEDLAGGGVPSNEHSYPRGSMYGIFTYIDP